MPHPCGAAAWKWPKSGGERSSDGQARRPVLLSLADEIQRAARFFVSWRPIAGRSEGGRAIGRVDVRGMRERSQFAGGGQGWHRAEAVQVVLEGLAGGVLGLLSSTADLCIGAVPGAFEGGNLALDADEELGGGGLGEQCGGE